MLIILTLFLGMAQGLQPVFSYFMGTGEEKRSKSLLGFSIKAFLAIGVLCYVLMVFFSRGFFTIFNPGDIELINFMESKSLPYFSGFFLAGFNILMISYWQANGRTSNALTVSLCRSVIWPPILVAVLPLIFGSEAVWLCHSISEIMTAISIVSLESAKMPFYRSTRHRKSGQEVFDLLPAFVAIRMAATLFQLIVDAVL